MTSAFVSGPRRLVICLAAAATLTAMSMTSASAATPGPAPGRPLSAQQKAMESTLTSQQKQAITARAQKSLQQFAKLQAAIRALDPYITRNADGTFSLNAPRHVIGGLNSGIVHQLEAGLATTNQRIRSGELTSTLDHGVHDAHATRPSPIVVSPQATWNDCGWWGCEAGFNEADTQTLEWILLIDGYSVMLINTVAAFLGLNPSYIAVGLISAALCAYGAWYIYSIDRGRGIIVEAAWSFSWYGIWAQ